MKIYDLPEKLEIVDVFYEINADFRNCLDIVIFFESPVQTDADKVCFLLQKLYKAVPTLPAERLETATRAAITFLDGGDFGTAYSGSETQSNRLFRWAKDAPLIFAGVDKVLGFSCRRAEKLHWWEFLNAFREIGDCTFTQVLHIRQAAANGTLNDRERRVLAENPALYALETADELREEQHFLKNFNAA